MRQRDKTAHTPGEGVQGSAPCAFSPLFDRTHCPGRHNGAHGRRERCCWYGNTAGCLRCTPAEALRSRVLPGARASRSGAPKRLPASESIGHAQLLCPARRPVFPQDFVPLSVLYARAHDTSQCLELEGPSAGVSLAGRLLQKPLLKESPSLLLAEVRDRCPGRPSGVCLGVARERHEFSPLPLTPSCPPRRRQAEHKVEYDQSVAAEYGCSMKSSLGSSLSTERIRDTDGAGGRWGRGCGQRCQEPTLGYEGTHSNRWVPGMGAE